MVKLILVEDLKFIKIKPNPYKDATVLVMFFFKKETITIVRREGMSATYYTNRLKLYHSLRIETDSTGLDYILPVDMYGVPGVPIHNHIRWTGTHVGKIKLLMKAISETSTDKKDYAKYREMHDRW